MEGQQFLSQEDIVVVGWNQEGHPVDFEEGLRVYLDVLKV